MSTDFWGDSEIIISVKNVDITLDWYYGFHISVNIVCVSAACFREKIDECFSDAQKLLYYAKYAGKTDASGVPLLTGFEEIFVEKTLNFFKQQVRFADVFFFTFVAGKI